jgi:hypothetical protein
VPAAVLCAVLVGALGVEAIGMLAILNRFNTEVEDE